MQKPIASNDVAPTRVPYPIIEAECKLYLAQRDSARREVALLRERAETAEAALADLTNDIGITLVDVRDTIENGVSISGAQWQAWLYAWERTGNAQNALAAAAGAAVRDE